MNRILWLIGIIAIFASQQTQATHVLGGELTYRYIGANGPANAPFQYQLRLKGYVDKGPTSSFSCGNFGNNPRIRIFDGSTTAEILRVSIPNETNPCTIPTYVIPKPPTCDVPGLDEIAIAVNDYTFDVNLPLPANLGSPNAGYYCTFQSCCRSDITTNLVNPGSTGNVYWAFIPSPILPNSSPQFADDAVPFICLNDTVSIINNASDPDGDKLIYSLTTPFGGAGNLNQLPPPGNSFYEQPVLAQFLATYTANNPFGNSGFASINSTTGLTKYFITAPGSYVVTIQIQEFRTLPSGVEVLLSTTRREFLILAQVCEDNPTPIGNGGAPGSTLIDTYTIFEGDSLTFNVGAVDPDSVFIETSGDILEGTNGYNGPLATFPDVQGATAASSTFKWKTTCGIRGAFAVNIKFSDRGCPPKTASATILINVLPFQAPAPIVGLDSVCSNSSIAAYNVVSNAPPNSLQWKAIGGIIAGTGIGSNVIVNWAQNPGTIRLIATSGQGCKDSVSRNIVFVNVPVVNISTGDSAFVCQGASINLAGSGGFNNYTWTGNNLSALTGATVSATPTQSGVYTVSSRGPGQCLSRDTTRLDFVPNVAFAGTDTSVCSNVPFQIGNSPVSRYNYAWQPANSGLNFDTIANPFATIANSSNNPLLRTFIQTVTHGPSNCQNTDTVVLTINPLPVVNAGSDTATICSNAKTLIGTTGNAQVNYLWSPATGLVSPTSDTTTVSLANPSFTDPLVFTYRLLAVNPTTTCSNTDSIQVKVNPLPQVVLGVNDSICSGQSISLGGASQINRAYQWSPGAGLSSSTVANPIYTNVNNGTNVLINNYRLVVTNTVTNCRNEDSLNLRINPLPVVSAGLDVSICSGDSAYIGSLNNELFTRSYAWIPTEGVGIVFGPISKVSGLNPNTGGADTSFTYVLRSTLNRTGCQNADSVVLTIKPLPIAEAGPDTVVTCSNIPIGIGSGSLANHQYSWTPANLVENDTLSNTQAEIVNPGQAQTTSQLIVRVQNRNSSCINRDTIYVKTNPLPLVNLSDRDSLCSGATLPLGADPVTGYGYSWSPVAGLSSAIIANPGISLTANPGQPYDTVYTLTVTIGNTGCVNEKPINIRVNPLPVPNAGPDLDVCSSDTIRIGTPIGSGFSVIWTPSAGLDNASNAHPLVQLVNPNTGGANQTQQYVIRQTSNQTGCQNADSAVVTIKPLPIAIASLTDTVVICSQQSTNLGSSPLASHAYVWNPALGLSSDVISNPVARLTNGTQLATFSRYILIVNNTTTTCTNRDTVTIQVNPLPIVVVGNNRSFCSGNTLQLGADPVADFGYQWNPASVRFSNTTISNPVYTNLNPTQLTADSTYFLRVVNLATGCSNADSIVISILPLPIAIAGENDTTCSGNTVQIGTTGETNRTYSWSSSTTTFNAAISNPGFIFTATTTTTNTLTVLVTNILTGCQSLDSVQITHQPRPDRVRLEPFVPTVCPFSPGIRYTIAEPPAGSSYQWNVLGGIIASGQGSSVLAVNWGATNANALVRFVPVNAFGCDGPADSANIVINQILRPRRPVGDSILCSAQALQRVYSSPTSVNSTYTWRTINGNPPSFNTTGNSFTLDWTITNGLGRVWVEEVASTLDSSTVPPTPVQCFGQSDTLIVRINPTPLADLSIGGLASTCSITSDSIVYSLPGFPASTYAWLVSPENGWTQRGGQGTSNYVLGWIGIGSYTISVTETSDQGCVGVPYTRIVDVNPLPRPVISGNSFAICPQILAGRNYTVGSSPNYPGVSTFSWTVNGGTFEGAGTGTAVRVNWSESNDRSLSVREISEFGCVKDTTLPLINDNSNLNMDLVTTLPEDDKVVQINFAAQNTENLLETLTLERTENGLNNWETIQANINKTTTVLTDNSINTSEKAYQYRVSTSNLCNVVLTTLPQNTILLNGFGRENPTALGPDNIKLTTLDWNVYQNWNPALAGYNLLRKVDSESSFTPYESGLAASVVRFEKDNGGEGFNQCYRIVAIQTGTNRLAYSNAICVDFKNVLKFTNVITPNGDNQNDRWYIDNLNLYPENELLIFDRWGKKAFEIKNYNDGNLWDGGNNKTGTYFFTFKENRNGQVFKGTITILE